jgi:hypothetical protein
VGLWVGLIIILTITIINGIVASEQNEQLELSGKAHL